MDFEQGDNVVVNNQLPLLAGETGTVRTPEYMSYVMVTMDNEELNKQAIGCFLPEELDQAK
jgi:hypothetical protein